MIFTKNGLIVTERVKEIKIADDLENVVNVIGRVDKRKKIQTKKHIGPRCVPGSKKVNKKQQERYIW